MRVREILKSQQIQEFCIRNHIRKLSMFGSHLTGKDQPDSDLDLLVEFEDEHTPSLIKIAGMERELSELLQVTKVDLRTPQDLSVYFRDRVVKEAEVQYARV